MMKAVVMSQYGWTPDYVHRKLTLRQLLLWFDYAMFLKNGSDIPDRSKPRSNDEIVNDINSKFEKKNGRWYVKNGC